MSTFEGGDIKIYYDDVKCKNRLSGFIRLNILLTESVNNKSPHPHRDGIFLSRRNPVFMH